MIPSHIFYLLTGVLIAFFYAGTAAGVGGIILRKLLKQCKSDILWSHLGVPGLGWLSFIFGQGILGVIWLIFSLLGMLKPWLVVGVCVLGWYGAGVIVFRFQTQIAKTYIQIKSDIISVSNHRSWYYWVGILMGILFILHGMSVLLPPTVTDALTRYLVMARMIAFQGNLELQQFAPPFYGLLPLQVELHWAALFTISNEAAVSVWDYLCALSLLTGTGVLAWLLTSGNRRVVLLAILMLFSTPAVFSLMGGGKTDNAAAQYGMAAFLCFTLLPIAGKKAALLAGLFAGWAVASRYTNIVIVPALIVLFLVVNKPLKNITSTAKNSMLQLSNVGFVNLALFGLGILITSAPMFAKNILLVGCPLAPQFGCPETFWTGTYQQSHASLENISITDLLLYPFVWTFSSRRDMLGNISPLFIGFAPFFVFDRRLLASPSARIAGLGGLMILVTWLLIEPRILFTRWLLIPLALLAVPLSLAFVRTENEAVGNYRWLLRIPMFLVLLFLLFGSRTIVYTARYVTSADSRDSFYRSRFTMLGGYDTAAWLAGHVQPGQRVGLAGYTGYRYFVESEQLLNSETADELQQLWEKRYCSDESQSWLDSCLNFYARQGFTYVVMDKKQIDKWNGVVFIGQNDVILEIQGVNR